MSPQGFINTWNTLTGKTKREWEQEKLREKQRQAEENAYALNRRKPNTQVAGNVGSAYGRAHDPVDAANAARNNVQNAQQTGGALQNTGMTKQQGTNTNNLDSVVQNINGRYTPQQQQIAKALQGAVSSDMFSMLTDEEQNQVLNSTNPQNATDMLNYIYKTYHK